MPLTPKGADSMYSLSGDGYHRCRPGINKGGGASRVPPCENLHVPSMRVVVSAYIFYKKEQYACTCSWNIKHLPVNIG